MTFSSPNARKLKINSKTRRQRKTNKNKSPTVESKKKNQKEIR